MQEGKNYQEQGDATNALVRYQQARAIAPQNVDVHLNLANVHLLADRPAEAVREAEEVLRLDANSAAAWFVKGSALLRSARFEEAVKAFQNVQQLDPSETATLFQLGRAWMGVQRWDQAIAAFREGIARDPNRLHTTAHYLLSQALLRAGKEEEARKELSQHQASLGTGSRPVNTATFERCKFTRARVPFRLDQPDPEGVSVRFVEATGDALGAGAAQYVGPVGIIDASEGNWYSLFILDRDAGFRLLRNRNGTFQPEQATQPTPAGWRHSKMLVGDLQNDRSPEVVVLGEAGSRVFGFGANGVVQDLSADSHLDGLKATDGLLIDLDFTGKLDLVAVATDSNVVQLHRQFGPLRFKEASEGSGLPAAAALQDAGHVEMADWNGDHQMDLIVDRSGKRPLFLEKVRGGPLRPHEMTNWVAGEGFCVGDFDNDLRPDLVVAGDGNLTVCWNHGGRSEIPVSPKAQCRQIVAVDYDNDGWLDLFWGGNGLRAWRNRGLSGFEEQTRRLGLDRFGGGAVAAIQFADFDRDCDPDALVSLAGGGLRYLRNEGGNANGQIKVRLSGNRSNASGIGCQVEIESGGLRLQRTVRGLPVEIGVGRHRQLDSFLVHWFNWPQGSAGLPVRCTEPILAVELTIQEGSCPYLYAWDGTEFRFVTDILGAAPLGLPVAEAVYSDADPEELVWIGDEDNFRPRSGAYEVRITEELREVLYLDDVKLVVADHPPNTEVHTTDKLLPAGPFPPGRLMTLHREHPLRRAVTLDGREVTAELTRVDGRRMSPPRRRVPQLRGLAEPHGVTLDFGPLETDRPLVLVMNGWLRFGGGMANIAASQDPSLPFPFPTLEAETLPGHWQPVPVTVGAPAGKTKTILVDLDGKLPPGARRLRLTEAFEIHWDRIALMEENRDAHTVLTYVDPAEADLHFRGFSALKDLPEDCPLTPDYQQVRTVSCWTIIPGGWCTAYGDVLELVARRDEGLALIDSGDELSLRFPAASLPPKPAGSVREFFLYADGWDKDSDFHVLAGDRVAPLPFHGMKMELYGREARPAFPTDALHQARNTRWVEARALKGGSSRPRTGAVE